MKKSELDEFEKISGQIISIYEEISILSKKNSNDAVNQFKLNIINRVIEESNRFLTEKYWPLGNFRSFDDASVPQTSDVVFILGQYIQCFEKYRSDNVARHSGSWCWVVEHEDTKKGVSYILTITPKKLKDN